MNVGANTYHQFFVPNGIDMTNYRLIQVAYSQSHEPVLIKDSQAHSISYDDTYRSIHVQISERESFLFNFNQLVQIQVRIQLANGSVIASKIMTTSAQECLDSNVLSAS